jgi:hypothetical protein
VDEYAHFELWNKLIYLYGRTLARKEYIGISITLGDGIRKLAIFLIDDHKFGSRVKSCGVSRLPVTSCCHTYSTHIKCLSPRSFNQHELYRYRGPSE